MRRKREGIRIAEMLADETKEDADFILSHAKRLLDEVYLEEEVYSPSVRPLAAGSTPSR
jgi:hypothetical protein